MSEYLDMPLRRLEQVADDIGAELRRVATILTNLESAMLAADGGGDQSSYEHAASSYAHWEQERDRLSWELEQIEEEIGVRNARADRAWGDWVTGV